MSDPRAKVRELVRGSQDGPGVPAAAAAAAVDTTLFAYARGFADGILELYGISPETFGGRDGADAYHAGVADGRDEDVAALHPAEPGMTHAAYLADVEP